MGFAIYINNCDSGDYRGGLFKVIILNGDIKNILEELDMALDKNT